MKEPFCENIAYDAFERPRTNSRRTDLPIHEINSVRKTSAKIVKMIDMMDSGDVQKETLVRYRRCN